MHVKFVSAMDLLSNICSLWLAADGRLHTVRQLKGKHKLNLKYNKPCLYFPARGVEAQNQSCIKNTGA